MLRAEMLARTLVELADTLVADFDVVGLLTLLAERCLEVINVGAAGLMLVAPGGDLRLIASSTEPMLAKSFEFLSREGPCLDCYHTGRQVASSDLGADDRWPQFAEGALAAGFRSVQVLPMRLRGVVIGALNLFQAEPGEMPQSDVVAAQAMADVATIAILQHRAALDVQAVREHLNHVLNSRIIIEQAKGMVAEWGSLSLDHAFSILRHHSRNHNQRMVEVARDVIDGALALSALDQPGVGKPTL